MQRIPQESSSFLVTAIWNIPAVLRSRISWRPRRRKLYVVTAKPIENVCMANAHGAFPAGPRAELSKQGHTVHRRFCAWRPERYREGLQSRDGTRVERVRRRRESLGAGEVDQGAHRAREGEAGSAQLRK